MAVNMYREYRLKFYLNMRHYIIINEVKGETHPHTCLLYTSDAADD